MKIRYQTGTATLIQLIIMLALNFVNAIASMIADCTQHDGCVSSVVINILFVLVLAGWLMFLAAVGYMAESKRSPGFAKLLIAGEALVAVVTFFNIRHYPNLLGLVTSLIDFALAVWVITLAWRLTKVDTTRPVAAPRGTRPRRRVKS